MNPAKPAQAMGLRGLSWCSTGNGTEPVSLDLAVWSKDPIPLPESLPSPAAWAQSGAELALEGEGWHILVMPGDDEPDDEVLSVLPEAQRVVYVTLEPIGAPTGAYL